MNIYIFDIDGVLADLRHRLRYKNRGDFDGFYEDKNVLDVLIVRLVILRILVLIVVKTKLTTQIAVIVSKRKNKKHS